MAMKTFVFENQNDKEKRDSQLLAALREYTGVDSAQILYTSRGKPYIKGLPEEKFMSITTADEVMVCVFSDKPVGVDGERINRVVNDSKDKKTDYVALAEKFFSEDEVEFVRDGDSESERFVKVWVRKEAYAKQSGKGMADFANFSVSDGLKLLNKVGGVPIKKLNVCFPGANEYLFVVAGEGEEISSKEK